MGQFDVIIVGAGLNGLVAALALGGRLARRPLIVAVFDKFDPQRFVNGTQDSRASALTLATQSMFAALGIWPDLALHAQNMNHILVTDSGDATDRPSLLSFTTEGTSKPAAALVENRYIYAAVLAEIAKSPHIHLQTGISDMAFGPGLAKITLDSGETISASLVIGADGRKSMVREKAGLKLQGWNYAQSAITLTVEHEIPHDGTAEEHFTESGVFAILPLCGNQSSLVWTEPHDEAKRLAQLSDADFLSALQSKFGSHRGALRQIGFRHVHPLSMFIANEMVAHRVALIGDAGHVIHPLAGLGLNLGFKDVAALADCVMDAVGLGADLGGSAVLARYASWRRFDTVSTAYLLDGMNRLFASDMLGIKWLRDMGLRLVDHSPTAKGYFMKEAAGKSGDLPRLMRGLAA
jgi:2-octaprenyl-6-methoxyphenol hydroxylase